MRPGKDRRSPVGDGLWLGGAGAWGVYVRGEDILGEIFYIRGRVKTVEVGQALTGKCDDNARPCRRHRGGPGSIKRQAGLGGRPAGWVAGRGSACGDRIVPRADDRSHNRTHTDRLTDSNVVVVFFLLRWSWLRQRSFITPSLNGQNVSRMFTTSPCKCDNVCCLFAAKICYAGRDVGTVLLRLHSANVQ